MIAALVIRGGPLSGRPADVIDGDEGRVCGAEHGDPEGQIQPTDWLLCWRPRDHEGPHWDLVERVAWLESVS